MSNKGMQCEVFSIGDRVFLDEINGNAYRQIGVIKDFNEETSLYSVVVNNVEIKIKEKCLKRVTTTPTIRVRICNSHFNPSTFYEEFKTYEELGRWMVSEYSRTSVISVAWCKHNCSECNYSYSDSGRTNYVCAL